MILDVHELYQQMLQSRVHIVVVREIDARVEFSRRWVESIIEYDQRQGGLYPSVILSLLNLFKAKCA